MAQIINVDNFPNFNLVERTELTADVAETETTLPIENESGFSTDNYILVGRPGAETTEIKEAQSVADEQIAVTATDMDHKQGDPVYLLRGAKARIYRAANVDGTRPTDPDSYTLIATIDLEADQLETEYTDSDAADGSDYWYLITYYNDLASAETDKDVKSAVRGGAYLDYASAAQVREEAGFTGNTEIPDALVAEKRDFAQDEVKSAIASKYTLPLANVPKIIENITILMGAGYLLLTSYGVGEEGTNKEGKDKIAQAEKKLAKIVSGEYTLLGVDEISIAEETAGFDGYPDAEAPDEEGRKFTMDQEF